MKDSDLKQFVQFHRMNILDDNKRVSKLGSCPVKYFQDPYDYNALTSMDCIKYETEKVYTIEVLESELERMAYFEAEVFNKMRERGHYNMFEYIMKQKENEKYLKNKYPAVKKAYEHYSLILKLAESGEM
jgi:hypothetical protein